MYNEDIQEDAAQMMKKLGFEMGRILPVAEFNITNAVVGTEEDGPFWYGDIDMAEDAARLTQLAASLGKRVRVTSDTSPLTMNVACR